MAKTLNQFLEGYLKVKNPDEQKFVDKHVVAKHSDRNGNDDEVFKGSKVKLIDRRKDRHGYNPGEDEKVYEELKGNQHKIDANKNGRIDAEDFKHLRKKKKVAEEAEQIDESSSFSAAAKKAEASRQRAIKRAVKAYKIHGNMDRAIRDHDLFANDAAKIRAHLGEEAEQIDELSKRTLGSYVKKAKKELSSSDYHVGRAVGARETGQKSNFSPELERKLAKRGKKRYDGIDKAVDKMMTKEEAEQIDELSKKTLGSYINKARSQESLGWYKQGNRSADSKDTRTVIKRNVGIQKAVDKLAKEEVQIDEISAETKASYMKKAAGEIGKLYDKSKTDARSAYKYYGRKNTMRKIANEEVELEEKLTAKTPMATYIKDFQKSDAPQFKGKSQEKRRAMAIAAKLTAERGGQPLRKEEKLADLLGDLTESHRRTMLSVFDKLNESNQKKFLEACETPEGVESMLDFSISHRGE